MNRDADLKNLIVGSQLVLGLMLFFAPWAVAFAGEQTPAWTAWITGALIGAAGIAGLVGQAHAASWANLVLGVWAILAPWLLGFAANANAMWSHVILGVLVVAAAAAELWMEHHSPPRVHA